MWPARRQEPSVEKSICLGWCFAVGPTEDKDFLRPSPCATLMPENIEIGSLYQRELSDLMEGPIYHVQVWPTIHADHVYFFFMQLRRWLSWFEPWVCSPRLRIPLSPIPLFGHYVCGPFKEPSLLVRIW